MLYEEKNKKYVFKYGFNSIYIRLYMIFIAILVLLLLVLWGFSYYYMSSVIKDKVNNASMHTLELIQNNVDGQYEKVKQILTNIALQNIISKDYQELSVGEKYYLTFDFLKQYEKPEYIESIGIYYYKSGTVMKFNYGSANIKYSRDIEWLAPYMQPNSLGIFITELDRNNENLNNSILTMIKGYPMFDIEKKGAVFANIDKNKFVNVVKDSLVLDNSFVVTDNNGSLVFGDSDLFEILNKQNNFINKQYKNIKINATNYVVSYLKSNNTQWSYYRVIDDNSLLYEARKFGNILFGIIFVCVIAGLFIWQPFAKRLYKPITNILDKFNPKVNNEYEKDSHNEFDLMNKLFNQMILQKEVAETIFNKSRAEFVKGLFYKLISEDVENWDVIKNQMQAMGFKYKNGMFVAMNLKFEGLQLELKEAEMGMILKEFMLKYSMEDKFIYTAIDKNSYIILLNIKLCSFEKYEIAVHLTEYFKQKYESDITIGIGRIYKDIENCSNTINEAIDALKFKAFVGKGAIIDINTLDQQQTGNNQYFHIAKEVQFIEAIKRGDTATSISIVNSVMDSISPTIEAIEMVPDILWQMINGIMIAIHAMNLKFDKVFGVNEFECYQRFTNIDEVQYMKNYIVNLIEGIAQYCAENSKGGNQEIVEKIKQYVNDHYNEDLSLIDLADFVQLSVPYVSSLFKKYTDENFVDYVRNVRMEKVIDMLKTSKLSINAIAEKAGYVNTRSFLRIFKNYTGITPTEYRKIYVINKN